MEVCFSLKGCVGWVERVKNKSTNMLESTRQVIGNLRVRRKLGRPGNQKKRQGKGGNYADRDVTPGKYCM